MGNAIRAVGEASRSTLGVRWGIGLGLADAGGFVEVRLVGLHSCRLQYSRTVKHAVTIKMILKSAQLNKSELMKNYYIQKADTLKHMLTGTLAEL